MYIQKFNFPIAVDSSQTYGSSTEQVTVTSSINSNCVKIKRDPLGIMPAYICLTSAGSWTVSSRLERLLQNVTGTNEAWLEKFNKEDFTDTKGTAFKNIWRVPAGTIATITKNCVTFDQYFNFFEMDLFEPTSNEESWLQFGSQILKNSVLARTLNTKSAVLVSGGFDSNLISKLSAPGTKFYTMNFSKTPEQDQGGLDNARHILGEKLIEFLAEDFTEDTFQYKTNRDPKCIIYDPSLWIFHPLLQVAKKQGVTQILTGLGGDDLFQPSLNYLSSFNFFKALKELKKLRQDDLSEGPFIGNIIKHLIWPKLLETSDKIWNLNYRFINSGRYALGIEQEQELAQHLGLSFTYPLLDLEVVRYVLSTPSKFLLGPYAHKNLLRKNGLKFLPENICRRVSQQDYSEWRKQVLTGRSSGLRNTIGMNSAFDDLVKSRYSLMCRNIANKKFQEHINYETTKAPLPEARS